MKKIVLLLALLGSIAAATGAVIGLAAPKLLDQRKYKGSGRMAERTIDAPAFDAIEASRAVEVRIADTPGEMIRIEADDNLIDFVVVECRRKRLKVSIDDAVTQFSNARVTVTVPRNGELKECHASSAARILCEKPVESDEIELDASSAAKIEMAVKARKCEVEASSAANVRALLDVESCEAKASSAAKIDIGGRAGNCEMEASSAANIRANLDMEACEAKASSSAKIRLEGKTCSCKADLSSAARLDAAECVAARCHVATSSGSLAEVCCTDRLEVRASSGSSVRYRGDCTAQIEKSSGASVRKE